MELEVTDKESGELFLLSSRFEENNRAITAYDAKIPQKARFVLQKIIQPLSIDVENFGQTLNEICAKRDDVAIENFFYEENSLSKISAEGNISEILKHYPQILVELITGNVTNALATASQKVSDSEAEVKKV